MKDWQTKATKIKVRGECAVVMHILSWNVWHNWASCVITYSSHCSIKAVASRATISTNSNTIFFSKVLLFSEPKQITWFHNLFCTGPHHCNAWSSDFSRGHSWAILVGCDSDPLKWSQIHRRLLRHLGWPERKITTQYFSTLYTQSTRLHFCYITHKAGD